jgi:NAD(P)-dependent dehydrogenase (short-subunit alcohol dehydrogenase family)
VTDAEAVRRAAAETRAQLGRVAHVVHCAGVLRVGPVSALDAADHALMIRVNYLGSVHVAQALLPQLREATDGRATLLLTASVAGLRGFPELAGYSASKFAVVGFAQALRDELAGGRVDVKVLCPPPGDTPMVRALPKLPPIYKLSKMYSAEEIVGAALKQLERRGWLMLVDPGSRALHAIDGVFPALVDRIVRFAGR